MSKKVSQKFVPGDVVRFDYVDHKGVKTYDREVAVEHVEDRNGDTLVGGHDHSLAIDDDENYRQFYLSQMRNVKTVDCVEDEKTAVKTENVVGLSKTQNDTFNELLKVFGFDPRPDSVKAGLLWDLELVHL